MIKSLITALLILLIYSIKLHSQEVVSYDRNEWHRKENREEIARIYYGEVDKAIENMMARLAGQDEKDPELLFGLSLAWSVKQNRNKSFDYFQEAMDHGLPISRFMVHLPGFETLHQSRGFRLAIAPYINKPVHGPMIGNLSDTEVNIWFRTWQEDKVAVIVYSNNQATANCLWNQYHKSRQRFYNSCIGYRFATPHRIFLQGFGKWSGCRPGVVIHYVAERKPNR